MGVFDVIIMQSVTVITLLKSIFQSKFQVDNKWHDNRNFIA